MREPSHWTPEDIEALLNVRNEDLQLEYKKSDALRNSKKTEITKDVSAMANSAGGVIIYGVDEQKASNGPIKLDGGIDPNEISPEWLEQVIDAGIQRRIDGLVIHPVAMASTGRLVYVVSIPQSNRAPHMASDHRYYKRLGTTTAMMEEYEVRDVGRRLESPDLYVDLAASPGTVTTVYLQPRLGNRSAEPALYATCRLYVAQELHIQPWHGTRWAQLGDVELLWNRSDRVVFHVVRLSWSIQRDHPILEGEEYPTDPLQVDVGVNYASIPQIHRFNVGWELRAPRTTPKLRGHKLVVDNQGPRIEYSYDLTGL